MTKLLLAGDFPTSEASRERKPFGGYLGRLLAGLMSETSLPPLRHCETINVFSTTPKPREELKYLFGPKRDGVPDTKPLNGKYILPEHWPDVERFRDYVAATKPNLVISLGSAALWALVAGKNSLGSVRGTVFESFVLHPDGIPIKVLPTHSPSDISKQWNLRPIVLIDFEKGAREMEFREVRRPSRTLWIRPGLNDIQLFYHKYMAPQLDEPWGVDIETKDGGITEISFCLPQIGIVIPFYSREKTNYWSTPQEEKQAWQLVAYFLDKLRCPVFQNGNYDISYLWRTMGIVVTHAGEDTMLLHHSLQPEIKKGLGFLASLYTDQPAWKGMRTKDTGTFKREDD